MSSGSGLVARATGGRGSSPGPGAYSVNRDEPGIQWTIGDRSRGSSRRSNRSAQSYNYSARRSSTRNTARSRMSSSREGY